MKGRWFEGRRRAMASLGALLLIAVGGASGAAGEELEGEALVEALRGGGYTIYFRHAATDWSLDDRVEKAGDWLSCDPKKMRQLAPEGRETVRRIGEAMRALRIPVGKVLASEYCRAWQTARLMDLGPVTRTRRIMNMRAVAHAGGREAVIRRARSVLAEPPPEGTNTVIVGHGNLMRAATGAYAGEGGSGVYAPRADSAQGFELVAELSPEDWLRLAKRMAAGG